MNNTILISGKAGSGKDTVAQFMKEELEKHGKKVLIIKYGDAVKWVLRDYFNWDGQKDIVGRTLLQRIGTDVVRAKHPNYWTAIVVGLLQCFEPYNDFDIALVPDARFPNEVDIALQELQNCVSVRVERRNEDGSEWINTALTEEQRQHPSETSLDHYAFDYVIHNDEGLDTLRESAETVLQDLKLI
jgi:dephospho-CoA kinase